MRTTIITIAFYGRLPIDNPAQRWITPCPSLTGLRERGKLFPDDERVKIPCYLGLVSCLLHVESTMNWLYPYSGDKQDENITSHTQTIQGIIWCLFIRWDGCWFSQMGEQGGDFAAFIVPSWLNYLLVPRCTTASSSTQSSFNGLSHPIISLEGFGV